MFPLLLLAALVAAVCAPVCLPAAENQWEFPALSHPYRELYSEVRALRADGSTTASLRLTALMDDADVSSSLLFLNMAGVAADVRPNPSPETRARLRAIALEVRELPRRWGAEPLLFAALNHREGLNAAELNDYLLDQLLSDNVPGNAHGATEVLMAALSRAPEAVLPAIEQRWDALGSPDQLDQEGLRLALLLLAHGAGMRQAWVEDMYSRLWREEDPPLAGLRADQRVRLADVAARVLCTPLAADTYYIQKDLMRPLASWVLFRHSREFTPAIVHVARHGELEGDVMYDVADVLVETGQISLLATPDFDRFVVQASGANWGYARDLMVMAFAAKSEAEREGFCPCPRCTARREQSAAITRALQPGRERLLRVVRASLHQGSANERLNRAQFLLECGDSESAPEIFEMMIAQTAEDSPEGANPAWRLWAGAPHNLRPSEELLEAGVNVAVGYNDIHMAYRLVDTMTSMVEGWNPAENTALIRLMLDNLRDDDTPNNGAMAYAMIYPHREAFTPMLSRISEDPSVDWQVRRAAQRLLQGETYLGDPALSIDYSEEPAEEQEPELETDKISLAITKID